MKIFFLAENEIFYDIIVENIEEIICQTDKYNPCTHLHTYPPTSVREHPKGAILETCDLADIWSKWDLTKNTSLKNTSKEW